MSLKFLLAGEPVETFHPDLDSGVILAKEIIERGHSLDYCNLISTPYDIPTEDYLSSLPVQKVEGAFLKKTPAFKLSKPRKVNAEEYHVILQRKDPPVDKLYRAHADHFAMLPEHIVQMNDPNMTTRFSEHLLPQKYPKYAVPTVLCKSFDAFVSKIQKYDGETVAKPMHFFSGIGIEFFSPKTPKNELEAYWKKYEPEVVVQPYIEEVTELGDVRILVMNEEIIGAVRRLPKPGSRLANLHQGATSSPTSPTPIQIEACEAVASDLSPKGLYLLGLDFIGDYLTEVNITCPSALRQINEMNGAEGEKVIIDQLEKLYLQYQSSRQN